MKKLIIFCLSFIFSAILVSGAVTKWETLNEDNLTLDQVKCSLIRSIPNFNPQIHDIFVLQEPKKEEPATKYNSCSLLFSTLRRSVAQQLISSSQISEKNITEIRSQLLTDKSGDNVERIEAANNILTIMSSSSGSVSFLQIGSPICIYNEENKIASAIGVYDVSKFYSDLRMLGVPGYESDSIKRKWTDPCSN